MVSVEEHVSSRGWVSGRCRLGEVGAFHPVWSVWLPCPRPGRHTASLGWSRAGRARRVLPGRLALLPLLHPPDPALRGGSLLPVWGASLCAPPLLGAFRVSWSRRLLQGAERQCHAVLGQGPRWHLSTPVALFCPLLSRDSLGVTCPFPLLLWSSVPHSVGQVFVPDCCRQSEGAFCPPRGPRGTHGQPLGFCRGSRGRPRGLGRGCGHEVPPGTAALLTGAPNWNLQGPEQATPQ